jgi:hypothetical protein
MSAQPIAYEDPLDPEVIYRDLPERERALFAREYRERAHAAAEHLSGYRDLKDFLHNWSLVVVAANQPGYYEAVAEAAAGTGETYSFTDKLITERARRGVN